MTAAEKLKGMNTRFWYNLERKSKKYAKLAYFNENRPKTSIKKIIYWGNL
jgi:hypothetical protein